MALLNPTQAYPHFVANQVLTQDQLNNMRTFLDSQNRATRVKLIGIGIVCGLHATVDIGNGTITISEGIGVTSDGWLICLPETTYAHVQAYEDPLVAETGGVEHPVYPHWQRAYPNHNDPGADKTQIPLQRLLVDPDPVNPSSPIVPADLEGNVLILYLEINENELKSCFTTDCNNKGQNIVLEVEAILAEKETRFEPHPSTITVQNIQPIPRLNAALRRVHNKIVPQVIVTTEINEAYQDLCDFLNTELIVRLPALYAANNVQLFDITSRQTDINNLSTNLNNLFSLADLNQYRYDAFKDIVGSYNELIEHLCTFKSTCRKDTICDYIIPCYPMPLDASSKDDKCFPRHLVIRDFTDATLSQTEACRHPFHPAPTNLLVNRDYEKAKLLFLRILDLIGSYTLANSSNDSLIKITPSQSELHPLSDRAIPFYYQKNTVEPSWLLDACCDKPVLSYSDNTIEEVEVGSDYPAYQISPLNYDLNACSFLRIEGHVHVDYDDALDRIITLRRQFHCDFQVLALPLQANSGGVGFPGGLLQVYEGIRKDCKDLYNRIDESDISSEKYESHIQSIEDKAERIKVRFQEWCQGQITIEPSCDYSNLQADYNLLRAEILCFLASCKTLFKNLPDVELEDASGDTGKICSDFSEVVEDTKYGRGINQLGDEILDYNGIPVTIHEFDDDFIDAYINVRPGVDPPFPISINGVSLRYDFSGTGLAVNRVEFRFSAAGSGVIDIHDRGGREFFFREIAGAGLINIYDDRAYFIEVIESQNGPNEFIGTITGNNISSFLFGGFKLDLYEVCIYGEGANTTIRKELPAYSFESRFDKIHVLCDLLEHLLVKEVRCLYFPLVGPILKDLVGAAIDIKLFLGCVFKVANGRFLPYRFYPEWNDLEDCLNHFHKNCYYSRLVVLATMFGEIRSASALTFGRFSQKYPGAMHRAGVSKGGTFIMVYQDEQRPEVIADFSLEHFVDDCCSCEIDIDNIKYPPVALSDYVIFEIEREGQDINGSIDVLTNDINLNSSRPVAFAGLPNDFSNKGARLDFDGGSNLVTYELNNARAGIDHFSYRIKNGEGEDEGHVHVLILLRRENSSGDRKDKDKGRIKGRVQHSDNRSDYILGAVIQVLKADGSKVGETQTRKGDFVLELEPGDKYRLSITHPNYKALPGAGEEKDSKYNFKVTADTDTDLGTYIMSPRELIDPSRVDKYRDVLDRVGDRLANEPAYKLTEAFFLNTVNRSDRSIRDVSATYSTVSAALIENLPAQGKVRQDYIALLRMANQSYMDRVVAEAPEIPDAQAIENLTAVKKRMDESGLSTNTLISTWKSTELKDQFGGKTATIDAIKAVFKR